eukprot:TRINITY_DN221_c1_g1_i1.p1 TRINITY_DN221_c1_g1~~TRINITY_DN221_c1_g1_i1.p1  ORF type:complete len:468 (-),score=110.50 TRINITY_DN221_c1_g1_i1:588-1991(-)
MGTIDIYENKENKSVMMESHYIIAMDKSSFINEDINCDIGNGKFIWEKLSQLIRMISKGDLPNPESDPMLFIQVLKSHPICAGLKRVSNKEDTDINGYNIFGINVQHLGSESGMYCDDLLDTRECQIIRGETWKRLHGETETALVPFRCKEIPRRFPVLESCHNIDSIEGSLLESLLTPLEENCPFDPSFYKPSPYPALNVPFQTFSDHFFENVCFRSEKKEPTSLNLMKEALLLGARNYPKDVQSMIFDTFEQMSSIATPQQSECVLNVSNFNHVTNQSTLKMKQMAQQQQFRHYNLEQQQFHDRVQQQQQQQHIFQQQHRYTGSEQQQQFHSQDHHQQHHFQQQQQLQKHQQFLFSGQQYQQQQRLEDQQQYQQRLQHQQFLVSDPQRQQEQYLLDQRHYNHNNGLYNSQYGITTPIESTKISLIFILNNINNNNNENLTIFNQVNNHTLTRSYIQIQTGVNRVL